MIFLTSLLLGGASVASIALTIRLLRLEGCANARFTIWFVALIALTLAIPGYALSSFWIPSAPIVSFAADTIHASASRIPSRSVLRSDVTPASRYGPLAPQPRAGVDIRSALLAIWFAGIAVSLARAFGGLLRLRALMTSAIPIATRSIGRGTVRIVVADLFKVPVAVGYRHAAVILPTAVLSLESGTDLENILLHELEHLRRFDDVTSLVQVLCLAVLWFNPFAYVIAHRLGAEREMACDEAVVSRTGKRAGYAKTLWTMAAYAPRPAAPGYLSAFRSPSSTIPRLENLLRAGPATPARRVLAAVLATLALQAPVVGLAIASPTFLNASQTFTAFAHVRLSDGDVLVVGGRNADGSASNVAQLYDERARRIALIPSNVARWAPTLTRLANGDVLVLGGVTSRGVTADAEVYDARARRFHRIAPMAFPRVGDTATLLLDGRVLIAGGERATNAFVAATEIYDPRSNRFTRTADGDGRIEETAILIDRGSVLLTGGRDGGGAAARCTIIYDPRTHGYRTGGTIVRRTSRIIVSRLRNGTIVRHFILSA